MDNPAEKPQFKTNQERVDWELHELRCYMFPHGDSFLPEGSQTWTPQSLMRIRDLLCEFAVNYRTKTKSRLILER